MKEHLDLLRERLGKAEAKEVRAQKALDSAKIETTELRIALRVMSELAGESPPASPVSVGDRQKAILGLLPMGEASPKAPADLFEAYIASSDEVINIDTFRTTLWRMKDKTYPDDWGAWTVKGDTGNYWKVAADKSARTVVEMGSNIPSQLSDDDLLGDEPPSDGPLRPASNWGEPTVRGGFADDLDDDIAF